jgi:hypothetical protein
MDPQVTPILPTHIVAISLVVGCLRLLQLIRLHSFTEELPKMGFFHVACLYIANLALEGLGTKL